MGGLVLAIVVGGLGFLAFRQATREIPGVALADLGNQHINALGDPHPPYNTSPPTSGHHIGTLAPRGIHPEQIPDELQVHNLEDGFVLVQYDCPEGCLEMVRQLEEAVRQGLGDNRSLILAPYKGIRTPKGVPARIALTAWTRMDAFDIFDRERVVRFIEAYEGIDHHPRQGF
ncbi:MAG: DUF3105 domain-containing protein [Chloroflexi bacterium]|nr:DUF3105 domain-containing protein [Chloroflexota bacterium]